MKHTLTQAKYASFQRAYDFFNRELFANALPDVLITLQRHAKAYGYFSPDRFVSRTQEGATCHELAMNPDHFCREDRETLSVLAHEMAHVWQQVCGTPPRKCYHDKEFAAKMKEIGLQPSSTGQPGGKETGQHMAHYIVEGGAFDKAYAKLAATGLKLEWSSLHAGDGKAEREKKAASKTKFTCPECEQNAWAKPDAHLICGACHEDDERIVPMEVAL